MKVYTVREIMGMFDVTPYTVWRWIKCGKLKAFKLGGNGNWRISEESLKEFKAN